VFCYLCSCSCSCHILVLVACVFHTLCQKKKEKKVAEILKKKVGVCSLNTKLRHLEVFLERKSWIKSPILDSPLNSEHFDL